MPLLFLFRPARGGAVFATALVLLASALPPARAEDVSEPAARRVYVTARLAGAAPVIDGVLDDACWTEGEWAGDYRQREPFQGAAPTHPTRIKILHDSRNLYVAIRATDPGIARQPKLLGERDEFSGDMVGVAFDSYFNRRTAFEFDVTSGGSKIDLVLRNDGTTDVNWNPVWDVKVSTDAEGWSAEYRIPLSQLRYARAPEQVWGLHAWRWIRRRQEESNWHLIPMDNTGVVRAFGELRGLADLPPSRRIELLPYSVVKYESPAPEPGNPFRRGGATTLSAGLDAKIGLGSDFTVDLTVNPDFGQVEADPSEINLSTVETFFAEKRPFFVEGQSLFDYALDDDLPFYSRRLGAAPSLQPVGAAFADLPQSTRILTAEKITGRTPGGFSLGLLHGLTDEMDAKACDADGHEWRETAEPMTHYFVARVQNDFDRGDTIVGGIVTGTRRIGPEDELATLPRQALAGGVDVQHYWGDRTYYFEARTLFTRVTGSAEAIAALQTDAVHNYQRADAGHLAVEPAARELTGDAGRVRIGKGHGRWRYFGGATWRSPGVDFNDLGYLAVADYVTKLAQVQYYDAAPGRFLRRRDVRLRVTDTQDCGGDTTERELELVSELAGLGNWYGWSEVGVDTARLDPRVLRGGPALRLPDRIRGDVYAESDNSRATQLKLDAGLYREPDTGSRYWRLGPTLAHRFGDRLKASAKVTCEDNRQDLQYAGATGPAGATRYVMGRMHQRSLASELRVQANFSPTLSLTYFGGPFASTGRFDDFKLVARPRAGRLGERFTAFDAVPSSSGGYTGTTGGETFRFDDPDFSWRELKSNLVLKWEFRPGSTFHAVWSQHRADGADIGDFSGFDEYRRLLSAHPDNTFLVKVSYWFSI